MTAGGAERTVGPVRGPMLNNLWGDGVLARQPPLAVLALVTGVAIAAGRPTTAGRLGIFVVALAVVLAPWLAATLSPNRFALNVGGLAAAAAGAGALAAASSGARVAAAIFALLSIA